MKILTDKVDRAALHTMAQTLFGNMIKAVVDIDRQIMAIDAELHADLEALLLENGSQQHSLWGINLYPDMHGADFIEFDSLINIRPSQGNRSRGVEIPDVREKIAHTVSKWVVL